MTLKSFKLEKKPTSSFEILKLRKKVKAFADNPKLVKKIWIENARNVHTSKLIQDSKLIPTEFKHEKSFRNGDDS